MTSELFETFTLMIKQRWLATWYRFSRRISSVVLPSTEQKKSSQSNSELLEFQLDRSRHRTGKHGPAKKNRK